MTRTLVICVGWTLLLRWAYAADPPPPPVEPSNFHFMLRGYCYAGSNIQDKEALGGFGRSANLPQPLEDLPSGIEADIVLLALPDEDPVFRDRFRGMTVKLINGTREVRAFSASDSRLSIVQEASVSGGDWEPIEYLPSSWCGNSYHEVFLGPRESWSFTAPRYEGSIPAKLRFSLRLNKDRRIYSNEFVGSINPEQLTTKEGHSPVSFMDPYNE